MGRHAAMRILTLRPRRTRRHLRFGRWTVGTARLEQIHEGGDCRLLGPPTPDEHVGSFAACLARLAVLGRRRCQGTTRRASKEVEFLQFDAVPRNRWLVWRRIDRCGPNTVSSTSQTPHIRRPAQPYESSRSIAVKKLLAVLAAVSAALSAPSVAYAVSVSSNDGSVRNRSASGCVAEPTWWASCDRHMATRSTTTATR